MKPILCLRQSFKRILLKTLPNVNLNLHNWKDLFVDLVGNSKNFFRKFDKYCKSCLYPFILTLVHRVINYYSLFQTLFMANTKGAFCFYCKILQQNWLGILLNTENPCKVPHSLQHSPWAKSISNTYSKIRSWKKMFFSIFAIVHCHFMDQADVHHQIQPRASQQCCIRAEFS